MNQERQVAHAAGLMRYWVDKEEYESVDFLLSIVKVPIVVKVALFVKEKVKDDPDAWQALLNYLSNLPD